LHRVDVTTTPDAGLLSARDEEHIAYALRTSRVIYTQDEDFLRLSATGVEHRGVTFSAQQTRSIGRLKGVTGNSLRNLAEIGNQPVDGTRRDLRWSLGGRGRAPRGTVPGGLNPHSGVGSGG